MIDGQSGEPAAARFDPMMEQQGQGQAVGPAGHPGRDMGGGLKGTEPRHHGAEIGGAERAWLRVGFGDHLQPRRWRSCFARC